MERRLKEILCMALATAGLAFAPGAGAAHATNFLDNLQMEVTNRLADTGAPVSKAQRRGLLNAARSLNRNTTTWAADLGALASATQQLNAGNANDGTLAARALTAIAQYSSEAHARLDGAYLWIGTNDVSRGLSNQLWKAEAALDRADAAPASVPARARALAAAFNKILSVEKKVRRLFPAPIILPPVIPPGVIANHPPITPPTAVSPGTPGLAPDSVGTRYVTLSENAIVNDQTVYYFSTAQTGAQIYNVHHPEELGLWTYIRTGADTAVILVTPNYPANPGRRVLNLTFTSATSGTFTGTTYFGETLEGTIAASP